MVMTTQEALCIIPARGGSKRIPRKNVKPFLGRPMIAHIIEAAQKSGCFDEIMVSTDDDEIAEIAIECGAHVPFRRSPETAHDLATFPKVLMEVLDEYRRRGREFRYACGAYATAALTRPEHLLEGFDKLRSDPALSYVVPLLPFGYTIQRALRTRTDGRLEMFQPENYTAQSQDFEKAYHDAGQWYWMRSEAMFQRIPVLGPDAGFVILSELDAHDIDNDVDWQMAELKYKLRTQ